MDASSYLVTSGPSVLIDCGTPAGFPFLIKKLTEVGYPVESLGLILGTHCHYDHIGAASQIKGQTNAPFRLHTEDVSAAEQRDTDRTCARFLYEAAFPPVKVDHQLGEETKLVMGEVEFTLVHTPGHTPGSLSVFANWHGFTVLVAGDTLWGGFHPKIASDIDRWHSSLKRLETYSCEVLVWGYSGSIVFGDARQRLAEMR